MMSRYECDGCGACCRTWRVLVSEEDALREPRIVQEGRSLPEHVRSTGWAYVLFPLPFHEGCCFLSADQRCDIYDTRPRVCRDFAAGSERCQEARKHSGLGELQPASGLTTLTVHGRDAGQAGGDAGASRDEKN
jgi:Fe-S-cluster containining protein